MVDKYKEKIEATTAAVLREAYNDEGWDLIKDHKGLKIQLRSEENNPIKSAKARSVIPFSPTELFDVLQGLDTYGEVDKLYVGGRVVEHIDETHEILYAIYSAGIILISNRDFLYLESRRHDEDGTKLIICFSVERDDVPEVEGNVRAHIFYSGWILKPYKPTPQERKKFKYGSESETWCDCLFIGQIDVRGWVPAWIVNQMSKECGSILTNLRKYFQKRKEKEKKKRAELTNEID